MFEDDFFSEMPKNVAKMPKNVFLTKIIFVSSIFIVIGSFFIKDIIENLKKLKKKYFNGGADSIIQWAFCRGQF